MQRLTLIRSAFVALSLALGVVSCSASCPNDVDNCGGCGLTCASTCQAGQCNNECSLFGACSIGETCSLALTAASNPSAPAVLWATVCVLRGGLPEGADCSSSTDACTSGTICLSTNGKTFTCVALCDAANPCAAGLVCQTNTNIPNGGGYCSP